MIVNTLVAGKVPPNGKRWKECPDSNTLYVRQVVFGNGIFVALCDDELYYSENSMNWVKCSFPDENTIVEIAHIRDIWLAQSNSSSGYHLYYSEDGKTWTKSSQTFGDIISIKKAKYGGGIYVTNDGGGKIFYSEDGKTWESSYDSGTGFCRNTCYGNGKWVATWNHYVLTSTDGKAWERSYSNSSYYFNNINYANGVYAVGLNDYGLLYSYDAINWYQTNITSGDFGLTSYILYNDGLWSVFRYDTKTLYISKDGKNWKEINLEFGVMADIAYGNGTFIIYSFIDSSTSERFIYRSTDLMETFEKIIVPWRISDLIHARGVWYASPYTRNVPLYYSKSK